MAVFPGGESRIVVFLGWLSRSLDAQRSGSEVDWRWSWNIQLVAPRVCLPEQFDSTGNKFPPEHYSCCDRDLCGRAGAGGGGGRRLVRRHRVRPRRPHLRVAPPHLRLRRVRHRDVCVCVGGGIEGRCGGPTDSR